MSRYLIPLYVVGGGFGLLMTACGLAWVYEKTRKKIEHPRLGQLTFYGDNWFGLKLFREGQPAVRFELPGDKQGPRTEHVDRFEQLWSNLEATLDKIRPQAIEEYAEIKDCYDAPEHLELISEISKSLETSKKQFDKYWTLYELGLHEEPKGKWYWMLEFEVAWDVEHTRAAYLDLDCQPLTYNLSCAGVDPWNA